MLCGAVLQYFTLFDSIDDRAFGRDDVYAEYAI